MNLRRCAFCTDDKQPEDIIQDGHINYSIREAVSMGLNPLWAIQMATINACECYGLKGKGALAPGYAADMIVLEDLEKFEVKQVYKDGELVARDGRMLKEAEQDPGRSVRDTVRIRNLVPGDFVMPLESDLVRVIRILPHSIVTESAVRKVDRDTEGNFAVNPRLDLLKMAVIERHGGKGHIGLGLVENYRMKGGAIASSIAHDSHNLIVIGDSDEDMALAANELIGSGGGICMVAKGKVLGKLDLPIAGLMSDKPAEQVSRILKDMLKTARTHLGVNPDLDPFMTLAFMALPVIPELKLTDEGLFDVTNFQFVDLCIR